MTALKYYLWPVFPNQKKDLSTRERFIQVFLPVFELFVKTLQVLKVP